jgi:hypothetical protein
MLAALLIGAFENVTGLWLLGHVETRCGREEFNVYQNLKLNVNTEIEIPSLPYRSVFQNFRVRIDILHLNYIPAMHLIYGAIDGVRVTNADCKLHSPRVLGCAIFAFLMRTLR